MICNILFIQLFSSLCILRRWSIRVNALCNTFIIISSNEEISLHLLLLLILFTLLCCVMRCFNYSLCWGIDYLYDRCVWALNKLHLWSFFHRGALLTCSDLEKLYPVYSAQMINYPQHGHNYGRSLFVPWTKMKNQISWIKIYLQIIKGKEPTTEKKHLVFLKIY